MDCEMRTDADLLNELANSGMMVHDRVSGHNVIITRKQLAHWTGVSQQTISDYGTGKYNIPIIFWNRILAHYLDHRILSELIPDDVITEIHLRNSEPLVNAQAFFRSALEVEKAHHEKMVNLVEILADGRIDDLDARAVQDFDDNYWLHRDRDHTLHFEVMRKFRAYEVRKGVRR